MNPSLSIIIPTLNEAETLKQTLDVVRCHTEILEVIVVDGGSSDATREVLETYDDVRVFDSIRGRGTQMHVGATAAAGSVLWFLHADTIPSADSIGQMLNALRDPKVIGGNFTICFDGDSRAAQFMTWLYPNLRKIGLFYGDSAIFVRREVYEKAGGFRALDLFEDVDLIKRIKRYGQIVHLSAKVVTSSRRFERHSFILTFLRWSIFQGLYWIGVSPNLLARLYPVRRGQSNTRYDQS